ncbi:MAG: 3-isopropylmalate dehydratase large subunit [Candidatus Atribacteria bacterium]|nr:3-isopropylmalate dehydratase large subunit [Candidatus Atribacteria bacterium]MCD6350016.1 3-isopropylmalate dehydratase large subunit [Candidatus Atribacteria bacterium]
MHALEKLLAKASRQNSVKTGEIIEAKVDLAEVNDLYLQVIKSFYEMGGEKVADPEGVAFVFDHYSPPPTIKAAENQMQMREFCKKMGIKKLFDIGEGVCHQLLAESGLVGPGRVIIETDSHTTTLGALGSFATGVGATDLAIILLTGHLWFKVPSIVNINLEGKPSFPVMAKDIILYILGKLKQDAAIYKAVEFTGPIISSMEMDERFVLCNMSVEMGAKTAYIQPDEITFNFLKMIDAKEEDFEVFTTDEDFNYLETHHIDIRDLKPQVALPGSVDNVTCVEEVEGTPITQVFIGTCTGGRLNDIKVAAEILKGKRVASNVRCIVIPASKKVFKESLELGYVQTLIDAGAVFVTPGCGPCLGAHEGVLASKDVCVSTSSRNFPGRMGSTQASIYLASPATAAASAISGKLTDPRKIL